MRQSISRSRLDTSWKHVSATAVSTRATCPLRGQRSCWIWTRHCQCQPTTNSTRIRGQQNCWRRFWSPSSGSTMRWISSGSSAKSTQTGRRSLDTAPWYAQRLSPPLRFTSTALPWTRQTESSANPDSMKTASFASSSAMSRTKVPS